MTGISDWPAYVHAVTPSDEAQLWDQGAEEALDQAVDIAGTRREATEYALIGIGMALRATNARLEALTDELAGLADTLAAPRPVRRPWWQRLTSAFTGHQRGEADAEACPDDDPDGDLDGDGQAATGDAAAPAAAGGATVTPLRRKQARS